MVPFKFIHRFCINIRTCHVQKPRYIPQFVHKIPADFHPLIRKQYILSLRCNEHNAIANGIRTIFLHEFQRIGGVTQRFTHLSPLHVPNHAGEIDILEGDFTFKLKARHDHSRYPEKDDVGAGDQIIRWMEVVKIGGLFRPVVNTHRPQP